MADNCIRTKILYVIQQVKKKSIPRSNAVTEGNRAGVKDIEIIFSGS